MPKYPSINYAFAPATYWSGLIRNPHRLNHLCRQSPRDAPQ